MTVVVINDMPRYSGEVSASTRLRIMVPSGAPRAIVHQLKREVTRILGLPEIRGRFEAIDFHVLTSTPEEFDRALRSDFEVFSRIARAAGLVAR
jgi:tripartite-type tricarboxylate transporter receptor subunit TctC